MANKPSQSLPTTTRAVLLQGALEAVKIENEDKDKGGDEVTGDKYDDGNDRDDEYETDTSSEVEIITQPRTSLPEITLRPGATSFIPQVRQILRPDAQSFTPQRRPPNDWIQRRLARPALERGRRVESREARQRLNMAQNIDQPLLTESNAPGRIPDSTPISKAPVKASSPTVFIPAPHPGPNTTTPINTPEIESIELAEQASLTENSLPGLPSEAEIAKLALSGPTTWPEYYTLRGAGIVPFNPMVNYGLLTFEVDPPEAQERYIGLRNPGEDVVVRPPRNPPFYIPPDLKSQAARDMQENGFFPPQLDIRQQTMEPWELRLTEYFDGFVPYHVAMELHHDYTTQRSNLFQRSLLHSEEMARLSKTLSDKNEEINNLLDSVQSQMYNTSPHTSKEDRRMKHHGGLGGFFEPGELDFKDIQASDIPTIPARKSAKAELGVFTKPSRSSSEVRRKLEEISTTVEILRCSVHLQMCATYLKKHDAEEAERELKRANEITRNLEATLRPGGGLGSRRFELDVLTGRRDYWSGRVEAGKRNYFRAYHAFESAEKIFGHDVPHECRHVSQWRARSFLMITK